MTDITDGSAPAAPGGEHLVELKGRLAEALATIRQLQADNERLRSSPAANPDGIPELRTGVDQSPADAVGTLDSRSGQDAKIGLFRRLFRGRDDVYAYRWESGDGRAGYSPALRSGARRERGRPADPRDLLALDDDVIRAHLLGRRVLGVYPLLSDETCWFLAIDFDKVGWWDDIQEVLKACDAIDVPAAIERSQSGRGGHLWIFFQSPVAATVARNLGCALLTAALEHRHQMGLDSYDRLFPSQDRMPKGGFGNLIAAPLQGTARRGGNTIFLGGDGQPIPDQWNYLSSLKRLAADDCQRLVREAARAGKVMGIDTTWFETEEDARQPWRLAPSRRRREAPFVGPLPTAVTVVIGNRVFIEKEGVPPVLISRLRRLAAFQNPEFYRKQAMRQSTYDEPRMIDCSEDFPDHLALPRGCLDEAVNLLQGYGIWVPVRDEREPGTPISVAFHGELTGDQQRAAEAIASSDIGVLSAPTAFGKTVIAAWLIAARGVNTLVLVHRQLLLDQWRERLAVFLDLPTGDIGQVGGGKRRPGGRIDIALLQSLSRKGEVADLVADYGHVLVDECHHVPAFSFDRVLLEVRARFVTGLTATPARKDGRHPIVAMQCGPIRHRVDPKKQAAARPFDHVVIPRVTAFRLPDDLRDPSIQQTYALLAADPARTAMIVADVADAVRAQRSPLVLTERTDHLEDLARLISVEVDNVVVLRGGMGVRQRKAVVERLRDIPEDQPRVLVATGRYIGEGFDDARLDTLFLALPVSWRGTIQQYAGRLHRLHSTKRVVRIFDYVDAGVPVLERMHQKRLLGYAAIGYEILSADTDARDHAVSEPALRLPI